MISAPGVALATGTRFFSTLPSAALTSTSCSATLRNSMSPPPACANAGPATAAASAIRAARMNCFLMLGSWWWSVDGGFELDDSGGGDCDGAETGLQGAAGEGRGVADRGVGANGAVDCEAAGHVGERGGQRVVDGHAVDAARAAEG